MRFSAQAPLKQFQAEEYSFEMKSKFSKLFEQSTEQLKCTNHSLTLHCDATDASSENIYWRKHPEDTWMETIKVVLAPELTLFS